MIKKPFYIKSNTLVFKKIFGFDEPVLPIGTLLRGWLSGFTFFLQLRHMPVIIHGKGTHAPDVRGYSLTQVSQERNGRWE